MQLETTIVDGLDLHIAPVNYSADPLKRTATGRGLMGLVHFMWPTGNRMKLLTLHYEELTHDETRRVLTALALATKHNKVLEFQRDGNGPLYSIPGRVDINAQLAGGRWELRIETPASMTGAVT